MIYFDFQLDNQELVIADFVQVKSLGNCFFSSSYHFLCICSAVEFLKKLIWGFLFIFFFFGVGVGWGLRKGIY